MHGVLFTLRRATNRRIFVGCVTLFSLLAVACGGAAAVSADSVAIGAQEAAVVSEAEDVPAPTSVATTIAVVAPTAGPSPTALSLPEPTPVFGPTGRPSAASEVQVLTAKASVSRPIVYDGPDGKVIPVPYQYLNGQVDPTYDWFVNPTFYGNPLALRVLTGEPGDDWAKVQIPTRPILEAWVSADEFTWSSSDYYVQVDLSTNEVRVWDGDEIIVDSIAVVTGDVGRETPVASTFVDEIMPGPSSAYGPWLLSLGVFSNAINTFGSAGGLPKVALHGTNRPDLLGQYASNGCIRLPNETIAMLADRVPVGTRVDLIRSG